METENTTPVIDNDLSFKEAFDAAVRDIEGHSEPQISTPQYTPENVAEDSSSTDNVEEEEVVEEPQESTEDSPSEPEVDYKSLYLQHQQRTDAQIGLLHSRLRDVSEKYQELKQQNKQQVPVIEDKPRELPNKVKEVFESYPDIGNAVQEYMQHMLGQTQNNLRKEMTGYIQPIQQHLVMSESQRHENAIKAAHPDVLDILQSGKLFSWIDSLPPVMRAGATHVYQNGSAPDVIALLSEYKQAVGILKQKPGPKPGVKRIESIKEAVAPKVDQMTKKIVSALGVPSNNAPIDLRETPSFKDEFNAYARDYEQRNRRR